MPKIKFSECPVEPHMGDEWSKLRDVKQGEIMVLKEVEVADVGEMPLTFWRADTFPDATWDFVYRLFAAFYRIEPTLVKGVPMIMLVFERSNGERITTARSYSVAKYRYYAACVGKNFETCKTYGGE